MAVDFCAICKVLEDVVAQGSIGLRTLAPRERSRSNVACQCRFRASPSGRPTPRLFCLRLCVRLLGRPSGAGRHPDTTRSEWRRHRGKPEPKKHAVHALVERGGRVSARHIPDVTAKTLRATLEKIAAECFLSEYCAAGLVDWVLRRCTRTGVGCRAPNRSHDLFAGLFLRMLLLRFERLDVAARKFRVERTRKRVDEGPIRLSRLPKLPARTSPLRQSCLAAEAVTLRCPRD